MSTQYRRAKGSTTPVSYPTFDSPKNHGWAELRTDDDGVIIWQLIQDGETIAAMKPSLDNAGFWNIAIETELGRQWFEFTGTLEYITSQVKRLYTALVDYQIFASGIDWECQEDYQPDFDTIPFAGEPMYSGNPATDEGGYSSYE